AGKLPPLGPASGTTVHTRAKSASRRRPATSKSSPQAPSPAAMPGRCDPWPGNIQPVIGRHPPHGGPCSPRLKEGQSWVSLPNTTREQGKCYGLPEVTSPGTGAGALIGAKSPEFRGAQLP